MEKGVVIFHKMNGCGNDFVVIDRKKLDRDLTLNEIKLLCDRNYGIGCDQLLIFELKKTDALELLVYNKDGTLAANCGNGVRCLGLLIKILKGEDKLEIKIVGGNTSKVKILSFDGLMSGSVYASLGPCSTTDNDDGVNVKIGNEHLVIQLDNLSNVDMGYGRYLSEKRKLNVSFVECHESKAKVRVYEKGAGETKSCGSAAAAVHAALGDSNETEVEFVISGEVIRAGSEVDENQSRNCYIIGKAEVVYEGEFYLK